MALSKTDIANHALSLMGDSRINSIDEENEESRLIKLLYEQVRDEVLARSGVNWTFATTRKDLGTASSTDPAFRWDNAFQLPGDVLRVINQVNDNDIANIPWARELDKILTDEDTCQILYIKRITDAAQFPPYFVAAVYTLLASRLAQRISQDREKAVELLRVYLEEALPTAIQANAEESYLANEAGLTRWDQRGRGLSQASLPLLLRE